MLAYSDRKLHCRSRAPRSRHRARPLRPYARNGARRWLPRDAVQRRRPDEHRRGCAMAVSGLRDPRDDPRGIPPPDCGLCRAPRHVPAARHQPSWMRREEVAKHPHLPGVRWYVLVVTTRVRGQDLLELVLECTQLVGGSGEAGIQHASGASPIEFQPWFILRNPAARQVGVPAEHYVAECASCSGGLRLIRYLEVDALARRRPGLSGLDDEAVPGQLAKRVQRRRRVSAEPVCERSDGKRPMPAELLEQLQPAWLCHGTQPSRISQY